MKTTYIIGSGDSDGLLSIATLLSVLGDSFISFTSPYTLSDSIEMLVKVPPKVQGKLYVVDLPIYSSKYLELKRELQKRPNVESWWFDHHNLPIWIKPDELPFDFSFLNPVVSSCENVHNALRSKLNVMIPAIASLNDRIADTPLIRVAKAEFGDGLYLHAKLLKFAIAYNNKDNRFRTTLVHQIKNGFLPGEISGVVERAGLAEANYRKWQDYAMQIKTSRDNLTYAEVQSMKGGYSNMLAGYMAENTGRMCGMIVLEMDQPIQKLNIICNNSQVNIGAIVQDITRTIGGYGGGSATTASVTILAEKKMRFISELDVKLSAYRN